MPNRATRRHPPVVTPTPTRITLPSGAWYEMGEMSGRDFLLMREMQGRSLGNSDVANVLAMIERRCGASSVADPIDQPISELMEVLRIWYTGTEEAALPPANARRSKRLLPTSRSNPTSRNPSRRPTPSTSSTGATSSRPAHTGTGPSAT